MQRNHWKQPAIIGVRQQRLLVSGGNFIHVYILSYLSTSSSSFGLSLAYIGNRMVRRSQPLTTPASSSAYILWRSRQMLSHSMDAKLHLLRSQTLSLHMDARIYRPSFSIDNCVLRTTEEIKPREFLYFHDSPLTGPQSCDRCYGLTLIK